LGGKRFSRENVPEMTELEGFLCKWKKWRKMGKRGKAHPQSLRWSSASFFREPRASPQPSP
jgi:hypothetical protein